MKRLLKAPLCIVASTVRCLNVFGSFVMYKERWTSVPTFDFLDASLSHQGVRIQKEYIHRSVSSYFSMLHERFTFKSVVFGQILAILVNFVLV
jgi:hypothetical protein